MLASSDTQAYYWRASEVSETLSGVTQLKIRDICGHIHMSFVLDLRVFVSSVVDPVPNFTKQNPLVY